MRAPEYRRVDWSQHLGFLTRIGALARQHRGDVERGRQIVTLCDPRPEAN